MKGRKSYPDYMCWGPIEPRSSVHMGCQGNLLLFQNSLRTAPPPPLSISQAAWRPLRRISSVEESWLRRLSQIEQLARPFRAEFKTFDNSVFCVSCRPFCCLANKLIHANVDMKSSPNVTFQHQLQPGLWKRPSPWTLRHHCPRPPDLACGSQPTTAIDARC